MQILPFTLTEFNRVEERVVSYFQNKVVVVIGATGALGTLSVRSLRAAGADVRLIVRTPQRLVPDLADLPLAVASIADRSALEMAFRDVTSNVAVDGILNCAGVVAFGAFSELSDDVAHELFLTNAVGTINSIALAAVGVRPDGFLASFTGVAGDMTIAGMGAYCASKAAAKSAMAVAGRELRSKKVRVVDIRVGHTETGLVNRSLEGAAPKMPVGLEPQRVVDRVLAAIESGDKDLPPESFGVLSE